MVHKDDMTYIDYDGRSVVGQIETFFSVEGEIFAKVKLLTMVGDDAACWTSVPMVDTIIDVSTISTTLFWSDRRGSRIRILPPVV